LSAEGGRETYCDMRSVKRVVGGRGAMVVVCARLRGFGGDGEGGLGCIKKLVGGLGWEAPMWGALSPLRAEGIWLRVRLHSTSDTAASDIVLGIDAISTRTRWIISILFTRFSIFTSTSQALDVHFRSHTLTVRGI
jgi:hypothetical protein